MKVVLIKYEHLYTEPSTSYEERTEIVEVEDLTELNEMYKKIIDVKILEVI